MAAMTIDAIVHRIGIIVDEVPASDVVHLAIAVIVAAIAGNFRRIRPDIGEQFGVVVVDAGIDYGHHYGAAAGVLVPGRDGIDVGARGAGHAKHDLSPVAHAPLPAEIGVIRHRRRMHDVVGLGVFDSGLALIPATHAFNIPAGGKLHPFDATETGNTSATCRRMQVGGMSA